MSVYPSVHPLPDCYYEDSNITLLSVRVCAPPPLFLVRKLMKSPFSLCACVPSINFVMKLMNHFAVCEPVYPPIAVRWAVANYYYII